MKRLLAVALLAAFVAPGLAGAADVQVSLSAAVEYDNNVGRVDQQEQRDAVLRAMPQFRFREDEGTINWDVVYRPAYEYAVDTGFIDDFRHFARAGASWDLSDRTQIFFNDRFLFSDALDTVSGFDENAEPFLATNTANVIRNSATLGVHHDLTPRLQGTASFTHRLFETQLQDRSDNQSYGGTLNLLYMLTPRHRLGAGVSSTYQDFEESANGRLPESQNLFVNLFGTWTWVVDDTLSFEVTAGPTFVDTQQPATTSTVSFATIGPGGSLGGITIAATAASGCNPTFVTLADCPGGYVELTGADETAFRMPSPSFTAPAVAADDTAWTIFVEAEVRKRWTPDIVSTLSYSRRDSAASGLGGSTVLDQINFTTSWRISEKWDTALGATAAFRDSLSPRRQIGGTTGGTLVLPSGETIVTFDDAMNVITENAIDTERYNAQWILNRWFTKNLSASARYTFVMQESANASLGRASDFTDHLVTLTLTYAFDRWTLW